MSADAIESLRRAYEAFARNDLAAVLEVMDPDVEWDASDAIAHIGVVRGRDEVRRYLEELTGPWEDFSLEPQEFIESGAGEDVMVLGITRGRLRAWRRRRRASRAGRRRP